MKINRKTHLEIRLYNLFFTLLFLVAVGLVAWLSTRYKTEFDWTAGKSHTLSEAGVKVLDLLKEPVTITAYARENKPLRDRIREQVERFVRHKKDLSLNFVNPDTQPEKVRQLGITTDGELRVEYQGRSEQIQEAGENALVNALQRLATAGERHVVFLEGHGERSPQGQANHDFGQFGDEMEKKGIRASMLNLATASSIPDNSDILILAGARANLLPGEVKLIQEYVAKGGNLLWLADPGDLHGLHPLAERLGVKFLPGVVVDASTQLLGIDDPTFALVAEYPPHPLTRNLQAMTLFPEAQALEAAEGGDYQREAFLRTLERSWTETGALEGKIEFNANKNERQGPLDIGVALTREVQPEPAPAIVDKDKKGKEAAKEPPKTGEGVTGKPKSQRIVVIGDGDFLSNAYLGNGGNLDLGLHLIHWLSHHEAFLDIPAKTAPDRHLELSPVASGLIAIGFLFLLPLALIGTGAAIWFQRRRR